MIDDIQLEQPPARMVTGALAHLARHMESGCPRAGRLAAMLLDQVANDVEADEVANGQFGASMSQNQDLADWPIWRNATGRNGHRSLTDDRPLPGSAIPLAAFRQ